MSLLSSAAARVLGLPPPTTPRVDAHRGIRLPAGDGVELLTDVYLPRPLATGTRLAISDRTVCHDPGRPSRLVLSTV
jgi:hypothetical protein